VSSGEAVKLDIAGTTGINAPSNIVHAVIHPKIDRREHVTIVQLRKRGWILHRIDNRFGVSANASIRSIRSTTTIPLSGVILMAIEPAHLMPIG